MAFKKAASISFQTCQHFLKTVIFSIQCLDCQAKSTMILGALKIVWKMKDSNISSLLAKKKSVETNFQFRSLLDGVFQKSAIKRIFTNFCHIWCLLLMMTFFHMSFLQFLVLKVSNLKLRNWVLLIALTSMINQWD